MRSVDHILSTFSPISLVEMDSVKLLNRTDTKFVLSYEQFEKVLIELNDTYQVLMIEGLRSARYQSLYFDTPKCKFYLNHHNGKPNRFKVRIRKYLDSNLCFLEIKHKKKGRTNKLRRPIIDFEMDLSPVSVEFINSRISSHPVLHPTLWNTFERITLVNNELKERLTFDLGLNFSWQGKEMGYPDVVIGELKQEMASRVTPGYAVFKSNGIREMRISKYCIGMGLLYREIKINNFKRKYLLLNQLQKNEYDTAIVLDREYI
jgi:hypothetical protein